MVRLSHKARVSFVIAIAIVASLGLVACGGGSSSASKEEIAKAERRGEKKGRVDRMEKEKGRQIEAELKTLKKEIKKRESRGVPNPDPAPEQTSPAQPESSPAPESDHTSCGGSLSVGPDTTCEFAENVQFAYESEIGAGSGTVYAYSPANDEIYEMFCTGAPHECTGAISAKVYFP